MKTARQKTLFSILILLAIFSLGISFRAIAFDGQSSISAAFFSAGISVKDLITKYVYGTSEQKIKILIVPGHEPNFGGAEYNGLKERDLNVELAQKISEQLMKNGRFDITLSRDNERWNPNIINYINDNWDSIVAWVKEKKNEMFKLENEGVVKSTSPIVYHAKAQLSPAIRLYGINKWAEKNNIDIVIHVHFNDNPKYKGEPNYQGFTIYVPEKQYSNSTSSKVLAQNIFDEISKIQRVSNLPGESGGITEDQDLIAVGSYNTSDSLSVLIEYAYIYEDFMQSTSTRNDFIDRAAYSTSKAVEDFFLSRSYFI